MKMPSNEEHRRSTEKKYGLRAEDLHTWMDEPYRTLGAKHRVVRHDPEDLPEWAVEKYGLEMAVKLMRDHVDLDTLKEREPSSKYRAILLIAGRGLRMGYLTNRTPKCLLEVADGKTILDVQLDALNAAGIREAYLVVGFYGWRVRELYGGSYKDMKLRYIDNPFHEITGGAHSLWLARERFADHYSLIMDGDHVIGSPLIKWLIETQHENCILVDHDKKEMTEDTQVVGHKGLVKYLAWSQDGQLINHVNPKDCVGEALIIVKLSPKASTILANELDRYVRESSDVLEVITPLNNTFRRTQCWYLPTGQMPWIEVDYKNELQIARVVTYPEVIKNE